MAHQNSLPSTVPVPMAVPKAVGVYLIIPFWIHKHCSQIAPADQPTKASYVVDSQLYTAVVLVKDSFP